MPRVSLQSNRIYELLPMQMARNITNRMALARFGSLTVTKKRMVIATLVEWIVAKFKHLLSAHFNVE